VLRVRTHGKALIRPACALMLLGGLLGVSTALVPTSYRPLGQYGVVAAVLLLAWWWSVLPYLRWRTTTYTLTNHRLTTRRGILSRTGHDLPLLRINNVSYQRSLMDRVLGCGSLYVMTAAEGALVLDDVPDVQRVHLAMTELLFLGRDRQQLPASQPPLAPQQPPAPTQPLPRLTRRERRRRARSAVPEQPLQWPVPSEHQLKGPATLPFGRVPTRQGSVGRR
jgi:membrane protein YdbS with pleckstrin-like domain